MGGRVGGRTFDRRQSDAGESHTKPLLVADRGGAGHSEHDGYRPVVYDVDRAPVDDAWLLDRRCEGDG